jgi:hypothetical protein
MILTIKIDAPSKKAAKAFLMSNELFEDSNALGGMAFDNEYVNYEYDWEIDGRVPSNAEFRKIP